MSVFGENNGGSTPWNIVSENKLAVIRASRTHRLASRRRRYVCLRECGVRRVAWRGEYAGCRSGRDVRCIIRAKMWAVALHSDTGRKEGPKHRTDPANDASSG